MSWINAFEIICYAITASLIADILKKKNYNELGLFFSAAIAGFILELLAVYLTDVYHYSDKYYITIGMAPYQFPFFGGLMWGSLAVCALRMAQKLKLSKSMTALFVGWIIVSMDLLLDVAAIRLNGGFWTWEGRELNLTINHHAFMSVIWVNFLGYLIETPTIVCLTLISWQKKQKTLLRKSLEILAISAAGVIAVGALSTLSMVLDKITDEWFSCIAFVFLWCFIFVKVCMQIIRMRSEFTLCGSKDYALIAFWTCIYGYCLCGLWSLHILQDVPVYGICACMLAAITLGLSAVNVKEEA